MIKINQKLENPLEHKTECLILPCPEEKTLSGTLKALDTALNGAITQAFENKRFEGKPNQPLLLNSSLKATNLLLVGVGKTKEITPEILCRASATAVKLAESSKFKSVSFYLSDSCFDAIAKGKSGFYGELSCAVAEGAGLALYHFDEYKTDRKSVV